ncbi:hypothetical protein [Streptomyces sp. NPDC052535]
MGAVLRRAWRIRAPPLRGSGLLCAGLLPVCGIVLESVVFEVR